MSREITRESAPIVPTPFQPPASGEQKWARQDGATPGEEPTSGWRQARVWWVSGGLTLLILGLVLGLVVRGTAVPGWDVAIGRLVQRPSWAGLDRIAWVASRIGDAWTGALVVSAVAAAYAFWRGRIDLAIFIASASTARAAGSVLKTLFQSPRPTSDLVTILEPVSGYGYPSGHALGAALIYGAIAIALPRVVPNRQLGRVVRGVALAMALLIAWARVRLGAHWCSDVVGGLLFGFGTVLLLYAAVATLREQMVRR